MHERPTDIPEGADSGDYLGWVRSSPPPPPKKNNRVSILTVRLKQHDRDRIDRVAAGLGLSTSEYVRVQLLSPDSIDVPAWRVAYRLVRTVVDHVAEQGVSAEGLETLQEFKKAFEFIVSDTFSRSTSRPTTGVSDSTVERLT